MFCRLLFKRCSKATLHAPFSVGWTTLPWNFQIEFGNPKSLVIYKFVLFNETHTNTNKLTNGINFVETRIWGINVLPFVVQNVFSAILQAPISVGWTTLPWKRAMPVRLSLKGWSTVNCIGIEIEFIIITTPVAAAASLPSSLTSTNSLQSAGVAVLLPYIQFLTNNK